MARRKRPQRPPEISGAVIDFVDDTHKQGDIIEVDEPQYHKIETLDAKPKQEESPAPSGNTININGREVLVIKSKTFTWMDNGKKKVLTYRDIKSPEITQKGQKGKISPFGWWPAKYAD